MTCRGLEQVACLEPAFSASRGPGDHISCTQKQPARAHALRARRGPCFFPLLAWVGYRAEPLGPYPDIRASRLSAPPNLFNASKNFAEGSDDSAELSEISAEGAWISDHVPVISAELSEISAEGAWISDQIPVISADPSVTSAEGAWISDHVPVISAEPSEISEVSLDVIGSPTVSYTHLTLPTILRV